MPQKTVAGHKTDSRHAPTHDRTFTHAPRAPHASNAGPSCGTLALLPAQSLGNGDTGYVRASNGSLNTWGGSIIAQQVCQSAGHTPTFHRCTPF